MVVMGSRSQGELKEHVLESRALLTLLATVDVSPGGVTPPVKAVCFRYLATVASSTMGTPDNNTTIVVDPALTLRVLPNSIVDHVQFATLWGDVRSTAYWAHNIGSDFVSSNIIDLIQFSM